MDIFTLIIFILSVLFLISSVLFFKEVKIGKVKIPLYPFITLIFASILIIFRRVSLTDIWNGFTSNSGINPLKILVLFFSMTILSINLDEIGFFKYLAIKATKISSKNQFSLFLILYLLSSTLTVFTSNDVVILTLTPFIAYFSKNSKINPIPYLVSLFASANTWSMMLLIGNPTNIYLSLSSGITFIGYLKVMWLPTILAGITEFLIIYLLFRKELKKSITITDIETNKMNKGLLIIGLVHLIICLIFLVISSYIDVEMYLISLISALSMFIVTIVYNLITKNKYTELIKTTKRLPYELIPFLLSMFIIVLALNNNGISEGIRNLIDNDYKIFTYGITSFISCNILNNIPMSVLYSTLGTSLKEVYSTIIGSNLGAFLTPIGALAGIMFTNLLKDHEINYQTKDFIKYGVIISIPTLLISLISLSIIFIFI